MTETIRIKYKGELLELIEDQWLKTAHDPKNLRVHWFLVIEEEKKDEKTNKRKTEKKES